MGLDDMRHQREGECIHCLPLRSGCPECAAMNATPDSGPWVIWSYEHDSWWAPMGIGYRTDLLLAGVYTEAEAKKIEASANMYPSKRLITNTNREGRNETALPLKVALLWNAADWPVGGTTMEWLLNANGRDLRALSRAVLP